MGVKPPLVGVAVNITVVPAQTGLADGDTDTLTGSKAGTDIIIGVEVAGLPVGQTALDVRITVTTSLFAGT